MSANALARKHYRAPTAYAEAEISLNEFSREDIVRHLRHLDGDDSVPTASSNFGELTFTDEELSRVATLALCGQRESAREYVLDAVSKHIGRKL